MNTFLHKLRTERSEEGFTLIELMIVVVIIGILAAIAIPIFANQQKAAQKATLQSDMKNSLLVVQTWLTKNPTAATFDGPAIDGMLSLSEGNRIYLHGTPKDFCVEGSNVNLTLDAPGYMLYSSPKGGKIDSGLWVSSQTCSAGALRLTLS